MNILPFKLERFFAQYEFKAPYLLCTSDCEPLILRDLIEIEKESETIEEIMKFSLGYIPTDGLPYLKECISALYQTAENEDIVVTNGAEEAIFLFMNVVLNREDHIIIQFPFYQSLGEIAKNIGASITFWECDSKDNWEIDINYLRDNIRENTRVIVLNMPHNPTGYIASIEKYNDIINIAKEKNIIVLNDEVYKGLELDEKYKLPYICDIYENGVSIGGLSKAFGLAGLRIGWLTTKNRALIKKINHFKDFTTICNSGISELIATLALKNRDKILLRNLSILKSNINLLNEFFNRYSQIFRYIPPRGGTIAFVELLTQTDVEQFCIDLVNSKGVLLLPGNYYDYDNRHFRIGFGRKNMPESLSVFESYINTLT